MKKKIEIIAAAFLFTFGFISNAKSQWQVRSAEQIECLCTLGSKIFGGGPSTLIVSEDSGATWSYPTHSLDKLEVLSLASNGLTLLAGTDSGVYRSTDEGKTWINNYPKFANPRILSFAQNGNNLFAADAGEVLRSVDSGKTWVDPYLNKYLPAGVEELVFKDQYLFAGTTYHGVFRSSDSARTWMSASTGLPDSCEIRALAILGTNMYAAAFLRGIFFSDTYGESWSVVNTTNDAQYFNSFAVVGSNLFAGAERSFGGVWLSTNKGLNWTVIGSMSRVRTLAIFGDYIFAGTNFGLYRALLSDFEINSVSNLQQDLNISFSPNPTTGIVSIRNAPENLTGISIVNVLGEKVLVLAAPHSADFTLDLSKLAAGIYFARFATENEVVTRKIIKE